MSLGPEVDWPLGNGQVVVKSFQHVHITDRGGELRRPWSGGPRRSNGAASWVSFLMELLSLFEPPNKRLQTKDMDFYTGTLVNSASDCVKKLQKIYFLHCGKMSALLQPRPPVLVPAREGAQ